MSLLRKIIPYRSALSTGWCTPFGRSIGLIRPQLRQYLSYRYFATKKSSSESTQMDKELENVRNIGIIAHIDAGKTTTTERMLYYSGKTSYIGDVDQGNTTMDYLQEERERGITIQSACITFQWGSHKFNLIDTPGHVDFTVEVERAVRVLDGAVAIVDAVSGVQAQTETVWKQADRYQVPRIVFVNKLDREGASLENATASLKKRFGVIPLVTQLPMNVSRSLDHIVDLVQMKHMKWTDESGEAIKTSKVKEQDSEYASIVSSRMSLLESIADLDDEFADVFLSKDNPLSISSDIIQNALRRITLDMRGVPVLCGASLRNIGVQPLLDAVISYLPSPLDRPPVLVHTQRDGKPLTLYPNSKGILSALAFKAVYDPQSGPIVFVRVYSGTLLARELLQVVDSHSGKVTSEDRSLRLLELEASQHNSVKGISAGHIGAIIGLKNTKTGDTIVRPKEKMTHCLPVVHIPEPVFYCSIEPMESNQYDALESALKHIQQEDPSFRMGFDEESGQLIIKGMGELHLEIVRNKLLSDYKIEAELGRMRVSYRETATEPIDEHIQYETLIKGKPSTASLSIRIEPMQIVIEPQEDGIDQESLTCHSHISLPKASNPLPALLKESILAGIDSALNRGPVMGYPLMGVKASVTGYEEFPDSSNTTFQLAAAEITRRALAKANPVLAEPLMKVEVSVTDEYVGDVLSDLTSRRRASIIEVINEEKGSSMGQCTVLADVPLAEMVGYATSLRSRTKGIGSFSMEFLRYQICSPEVQKKIMESPF